MGPGRYGFKPRRAAPPRPDGDSTTHGLPTAEHAVLRDGQRRKPTGERTGAFGLLSQISRTYVYAGGQPPFLGRT